MSASTSTSAPTDRDNSTSDADVPPADAASRAFAPSSFSSTVEAGGNGGGGAVGLCGDLPPGAGACGLRLKDLRLREKGEGLIERSIERGEGLISKLKKRSSIGPSGAAGEASLYDPSLYLCAGGGDDDDDGPRCEEDDERPIPASVIGDPSRTVCVVTTAALPWRTGTAVNPLLRALYLVRHQEEGRKRRSRGESQPEREKNDDKERAAHAKNVNAITGCVVLVIPWLESSEDRIKLYGTANSFSDGQEGMRQQEEWIRNYCVERCGMPHEASILELIFYPAFYLAGFGSIFPKVDLCNFIPRERVDVAVLEEPEHLNWFRMPMTGNERKVQEDDCSLSSGDDEEGATEKPPTMSGRSGVFGQTVEVSIEESSSHDITAILEKPTISVDANDENGSFDGKDEDDKDIKSKENCSSHSKTADKDNNAKPKKNYVVSRAKLGWTHRFRFVVGIVHTNYEAYARFAAPAIGAVSALAIRAHCHQVIKLSGTLPSFAPGKEVTCNVHGVRREFLEGVASLPGGGKHIDGDGKKNEHNNDDDDGDDAPSPVYFIGKLVWAKGFEIMLQLQHIFRKRNGNYFHIDIYGGGPDEKTIARAFHGRHHKSPARRPPPPATSKEPSSSSPDSSSRPVAVAARDLNAAAVLMNPRSIKHQSSQAIELMRKNDRCGNDDVVSQYLSLGFEVSQMNGSATYHESRRRGLDGVASEAEAGEDRDQSSSSTNMSATSNNKNANPLDILGDLSGKSFDTGVKTSQAVYNIADTSIKNILTMSFSQLKHPLKARRSRAKKNKEKAEDENINDAAVAVTEEDKEEGKPHFVFDPPASRYEWRRHPIPAKFLGVIDHAQLKNAQHGIFLNPSTSEVLCTTTAEALAMNKFVILPRHPSNEFFLQFANCLSYDTLEECADKMAWALENAPAKLTAEEQRRFTWEAATERLLGASTVTVGSARERAKNGMDKTDARIAYWLSESGEKSNMIRNLFHMNGGGGGEYSPLL